MLSINKNQSEKNYLIKNKSITHFSFNHEYLMIPDLVDIQRMSFKNFIVSGLFKTLKEKKSISLKKNNYKLEIIFFAEWIRFKKPEIKPKTAIDLRKT